MFSKILIANRGDSGPLAAAAKPERVVRAAHAGERAPMEQPHV